MDPANHAKDAEEKLKKLQAENKALRAAERQAELERLGHNVRMEQLRLAQHEALVAKEHAENAERERDEAKREAATLRKQLDRAEELRADAYAAGKRVSEAQGVDAVMKAAAAPRACTDPRHDTPCVYDGCTACEEECEPPAVAPKSDDPDEDDDFTRIVQEAPASWSDIVSDGGMDPRNRPGGYEDQHRSPTAVSDCIAAGKVADHRCTPERYACVAPPAKPEEEPLRKRVQAALELLKQCRFDNEFCCHDAAAGFACEHRHAKDVELLQSAITLLRTAIDAGGNSNG